MSGEVDINAPTLRVVAREEWGALPPTQELQPLRKPCIAWRYWKYSDTPACSTQEECINVVRGLQKRHIEQDLGDIRYNFLIGDDGNVYEGRGFDSEPPKDEILSEIWGRYLEIGFIGNHRETPRTHNIYYLAYLILDAAIKNGSLKYEAYALPED